MSEIHQTANLELNTLHIQLADGQAYTPLLHDTNTSKGQISVNGQSLTWKNVDMLAVLGDLFDQYEQFNIRMVSYNGTTGVNVQFGVDFSNSAVYLSFGGNGARLINQSYNHLIGGVIGETCIGIASFFGAANTSFGSGTSTLGSNIVTFTVNSRYCDITLDIRNFRSISGKVNYLIGHMCFFFDIIPVLSSRKANK